MNFNYQKLLKRLPVILLILQGSLLWNTPASAAEFCSDEYYIDVTLPNQARWDMCWEHRQREGVVLHKIHYTPRNGERRMVLNEAAVAQIHVPYDDNGARYHDVTDYGLGNNYLKALTFAECPGGDLLKHNNKNVVCQQTESRGTTYSYDNDRLQGDALSLFSVSAIGAYNYIPSWRFLDDGSIEPGMGATGALQRFGTSVKEDHGWLLATNKIGLAHLHNFFWKLDFDLAGTRNNDYVEELNFVQGNGRVTRQNTRFQTEQARKVSPDTARRWVIADGAITNDKGQPISYEIRLHQSEHRDEGPETEPFTHHDIYVTRHTSCELFASRNPTTEGCSNNVSAFVNDESLEGHDIVVWPSTTFYHMPRTEDAPHMDIHWSYLSITPRDWHDKNPLSDSAETDGNEPSTGGGTGSGSGGGSGTTSTVYEENFDTASNGWNSNPAGTDSANKGQWEIANPQATAYQGLAMQLDSTPSGNQALVTGAAAGSLVGSFDIDGGVTSMQSPLIDLTESGSYSLTLSYYFAHYRNTTRSDFLRITAVSENGSRKVLLEERGNAANRAASWKTLNSDLSDLAGSRIHLIIEAADGGTGSIVEAAIDKIVIKRTGSSSGNSGSFGGNTGTRGETLFSDDFESTLQWRRNAANDDTAHAGQWENGTPQTTRFQNITMQPVGASSGSRALLTGYQSGATVGAHDIDGGKTSIRSPRIDLPAGNAFQLSLNYYFAHLWNTTTADYLSMSIETANGQREEIFLLTGTSENRPAEWHSFNHDLSRYSNNSIYLLIEAADGGAGSLVEAGIDNIRITYQ